MFVSGSSLRQRSERGMKGLVRRVLQWVAECSFLLSVLVVWRVNEVREFKVAVKQVQGLANLHLPFLVGVPGPVPVSAPRISAITVRPLRAVP